MTRDDIIRMAQEAGFWIDNPDDAPTIYESAAQMFERFAALVAAAEREECAKVCETLGVHPELNVWNGGPDWYKHGKKCADAIRAVEAAHGIKE